MTSQGAFTGQFDTDMNEQQLIGGKANLQQFDHFLQALSNATVKICGSTFTEDAQYVINNLEEVKIDEPEIPGDSLLETVKGPMYISNYNNATKCFNDRQDAYRSNKSRMCSVILAQCDPVMDAKLQVTKGWLENKTDLLFFLMAAQAACIGVQKNYSKHIVVREAFRPLASCFQNSDTALVFKTRYLPCKQKCNKAGISFKFTKKILDSEKQ